MTHVVKTMYTLRSGRVVSSIDNHNVCTVSTIKPPGRRSSKNSPSTQQTSSTNDTQSLNNAHLDTDVHSGGSVTVSSKLAAKASVVGDIEDLVGGQHTTWGDNTGLSVPPLNHDFIGVKIKQEPGTSPACHSGVPPWPPFGYGGFMGQGEVQIKPEPGTSPAACHGGSAPLNHGIMGQQIRQEPGTSAVCFGGAPLNHSFMGQQIKQEPGTSPACHGGAPPAPWPPPVHYGGFMGQLGEVNIKQEPGTSSACINGPPAWPPLNYGSFMGQLGEVNFKQEPGTGPVKRELLDSPDTPRGGVKKKVRINGEDFISWDPPFWKEQYENIRTMRVDRTAPVDTHGCFMLAQRDVPPEVRRYQVLVSLMLSSQTKDLMTGQAMGKLTKHGLTVENILKTPQENIAKMIYGVGFWNRKAEYIKRTTELISTKYKGDIPKTVKELMSLPGIGPKMSHLIMDFAWGEVSGIAVDTHVHRIVHRLGWTPMELTNPEDCRVFLEAWFPRNEWSDLNLLFVGFGQQTCTPLAPKCTGCLNKDMCPASSTRPENDGKAMFGKIGARKKKSPKKVGVRVKQEK